MSITPIEWSSNTHRWAVIRYFKNPADSDCVSQHTTPRQAILRCQQWIQSDPWTFPDGYGALSHYYDVEARDTAAAMDLAVARQEIAAEDAAAGRLSRFPRYDEPGGQELRPGDDDEPGETAAQLVLVKEMVVGPCRTSRPLRSSGGSSATASSCVRRKIHGQA